MPTPGARSRSTVLPRSVVVQSWYVGIALVPAMLLWTVLPEANEAVFSVAGARFGGAAAAFIFVLLLLNHRGPLQALRDADARALQTVQAEVLLEATSVDQYNVLFDGFDDGTFRAFNAPFKVEGSPGTRIYEAAMKTHVRRYRGGVSAHYLFHDPQSLGRARRFFDDVGKRLDAEDKQISIEIRQASDAPPGYTFFTGLKSGVPACVFYPTAAVRDGIPQAVLYITGARDLTGILNAHFNDQWAQGRGANAAQVDEAAEPPSQAPKAVA